jgi:phage protein D
MPRSDPPDFDLSVNGSRLPAEALADVRSVTVQEDLDALSMFSVVLANWDDERQRVTWSDSSLFAVGNEVRISLGYVNDLRQVMTAEITSLEPEFVAAEPPTLTVRGYDHRHRLARGRRTRSFSQMKDSAIANQLAREAGLRSSVQDTKSTLPFVVQTNQSDWEFLRGRARRIGYEAYVRDKVLYFHPPRYSDPATATLSLGADVVEFTPRLSALGQVDSVTVRGWAVPQKQVIEGQAAVGVEDTMGGASSGPRTARRAFGRAGAPAFGLALRSKEEADQIALGRYTTAALAYVHGEVACEGRTDLRAGTVVAIDGAGGNFSGAYYVTAVTHILTEEHGYRTSLVVRRNAA